jgi:hypothetical protein
MCCGPLEVHKLLSVKCFLPFTEEPVCISSENAWPVARNNSPFWGSCHAHLFFSYPTLPSDDRKRVRISKAKQRWPFTLNKPTLRKKSFSFECLKCKALSRNWGKWDDFRQITMEFYKTVTVLIKQNLGQMEYFCKAYNFRKVWDTPLLHTYSNYKYYIHPQNVTPCPKASKSVA